MVAPMQWQYWLVLLIVNVGAGLLLFRANTHRRLLTVDLVAGVAVLLSIDILFILSNFLIDRTQCGSSPTAACLVNSNRGVWTFGAMCVASITLYVNARMKQGDERNAELRRRAHTSTSISAALDELIHNLQHFAREISDDDEFITFPATTLDASYSLCNADTAIYCSPAVLSSIRLIQRITAHNRSILRSIGEVYPAIRPVSILDESGIATFSKMVWLASMRENTVEKPEGQAPADRDDSKQEHRSPLHYVRFDPRIVTHSIHCIIAIGLHHPREARHVLERPEFKWLEKLRESAPKHYYYYAKSSEVSDAESAALRSDGLVLYCWIKDRPIDNVEIVPIRVAFRDLAHGRH